MVERVHNYFAQKNIDSNKFQLPTFFSKNYFLMNPGTSVHRNVHHDMDITTTNNGITVAPSHNQQAQHTTQHSVLTANTNSSKNTFTFNTLHKCYIKLEHFTKVKPNFKLSSSMEVTHSSGTLERITADCASDILETEFTVGFTLHA